MLKLHLYELVEFDIKSLGKQKRNIYLECEAWVVWWRQTNSITKPTESGIYKFQECNEGYQTG